MPDTVTLRRIMGASWGNRVAGALAAPGGVDRGFEDDRDDDTSYGEPHADADSCDDDGVMMKMIVIDALW